MYYFIYFLGGHGTFSNIVNNLVHVIMYSYYMVAAMGPKYQKYLWWKKHLTTLQLVSISIKNFLTRLLGKVTNNVGFRYPLPLLKLSDCGLHWHRKYPKQMFCCL